MSVRSNITRVVDHARVHGLAATARRLRHGIAWRADHARSRVYRVPAVASVRRRVFIARRAARHRAGRRRLGTTTIDVATEQLAAIQLPPRPAADTEAEPAPGPELSVAIVVPAYQAEPFLDACLESVSRQIFDRWRCYVIDDGSTDRTSEIAAAWERRDPRFRLIRHGRNSGLSAARNTGLREAIEPAVTFLDADDLLVSRSLDRRVAELRRVWSDDAIAGVWSVTPQVPEETTVDEAEAIDEPIANHDVDFVRSGGECPFNAHGPLLRTELLRRLGGFDESFQRGAEDWDLWQRVLRHGYTFRGIAGVAGVYRQRRASMVRRDPSGHLETADLLLRRADSVALVDPELCVDPAAARPIGELVTAERRLQRAAIYAGISVGSSGELGAAADPAILGFLAPLTDAQLVRTNVESSARAGLHRGLGLGVASANVDEGLAVRIAEIGEALARDLRTAVAGLAEGAAADETGGADRTVDLRPVEAEVDALLVAESAADVAPLAEIAATLERDGKRVAHLDLEIVKGDEGAPKAWAATGVPGVPFNHFAFGRIVTSTIVVRRPFGPVTAEVITAVGDAIEVVELPAPEREIELDEHPSAALALPAFDPGAVGGRPGAATRMQSNFGRLLLKEEGPLEPRSIALLDELHNRHEGETVVVVGNGPSLNETPIEQLHGVPTIAVNGIFYAADRFPDPITYFVVEDTSVFRENTQAIKDFEAGFKLFPTSYLDAFDESELGDRLAFFRMNGGFYGRDTGTLCHPRFSVDPRQRLFCGQSVTIINLQLAYWMGFARVVLIGMDFSYTIPDDVDREGDVLTSNSDDVNHFHPDYFGKGKTWKDPKLERVLVNYRLAGEMFAADGREIVNATVGGRLEVFRRMDLLDAVKAPVS